MAQEFDIVPINTLIEANDSEISNGQILIVTGNRAKRAPSLKMKGAKGDKGDNAYLRNTGTYVQWRLGLNGVWQNLISITDITGPKGEKPIFKTTSVGIEYKYENEPDTAFKLLIPYDVLKLKFTDLTAGQKDELTLHYSDLTQDQIKELQQPAIDAAEEISQLQQVLEEREEGRVAAESIREENEATRKVNETARKSAETKRVNKETDRNTAEEGRVTAETARVEVEKLRVTAETDRETAEITREENEEARQANTASALESAIKATDRLKTLSDHRDEIRDGFWWHWNEEAEEYENTGEKAKGDVMLATFIVDFSAGELIMRTPDGYNGPQFVIKEGNLIVMI